MDVFFRKTTFVFIDLSVDTKPVHFICQMIADLLGSNNILFHRKVALLVEKCFDKNDNSKLCGKVLKLPKIH